MSCQSLISCGYDVCMTSTSITSQLQTLLATATEEFNTARTAYAQGKNGSYKPYMEATALLEQVVALCEANGIEVK
jgi:hypothetical protein